MNIDTIATMTVYEEQIKRIAEARTKKYVEHKLFEELGEYKEFPSDEEIIDIFNVTSIMLAQRNITPEQVLLKLNKRKIKYKDRV